MEECNLEQMEMPTPCEHCGKIFDLNDGRRSDKWHLDITICEQCGIEEMQEIEEDDIIEVANHDLGEALFDFKERGWGKVSDENKALIIQLVVGRALIEIPKPYIEDADTIEVDGGIYAVVGRVSKCYIPKEDLDDVIHIAN